MPPSEPESPLQFGAVDLEALPVVAREILAYGGERRLFLLVGPPGAGKTTLIQAMLRHLGVTDPVTSPTFAIVQLYHNAQGQRFAHLDLYRIQSAGEAEEAGLDEILREPFDKIFVEWPSQVPALFEGSDAVAIALQPEGAVRTLTVRGR